MGLCSGGGRWHIENPYLGFYCLFSAGGTGNGHMAGSIMLRILLFVVSDMCWDRSRHGSFHAMGLLHVGSSVY